MGIGRRHLLDGHDGAAKLPVQLDHLRQHAIPLQVQTEIVRQHYGKRLVTNQRATAENRMPQAAHADLAGVGKTAVFDQMANAMQVALLVTALNLLFQLVADIEMIFQGTLAAPGYHGDFMQASLQGFFHPVLDQRLVHHRQHLLGHGLGRRQEARAITGGGKQAFLQ